MLSLQTELIGLVLGGSYEIERLIGEGGMGAVYEAKHVRLPRKFAVKMLNAQALVAPSGRMNYKIETSYAARPQMHRLDV